MAVYIIISFPFRKNDPPYTDTFQAEKRIKMTITQLQYFLQICDCNGMTHAASHLNISQQALSKTVHSLESELGASLFFRTKTGLVLTPVGELLRDQCRPVVRQFDDFSAQLTRDIHILDGTMRLCIFEDSLSLITMCDYDRFRAHFPQYTLIIQEYQYHICNQRLLDGKHDAALTIQPISDKNVVNIPLQSREIVFLIQENSPLSQSSVIRFRDIQQRQIFASIDNLGYQMFCQLCSEQHIQPLINRVSQLPNMFDICSANGYIGLTAAYSAKKYVHRYPNLVIRHIEGAPAPYNVTLSYHVDNAKMDMLNKLTLFMKESIASD